MNRLLDPDLKLLLIVAVLTAGSAGIYWKSSHRIEPQEGLPASAENDSDNDDGDTTGDENNNDNGDNPHASGSPSENPSENEQSGTDGRPNVLLISIDTLRADHLGCFGYPKPTSPNLDRFAGQNILFKNCRSQAPWTLPSHMSLFTSMLPSDNGVDNLNKVLVPEVSTLAEVLRDEGYKTAALVNNGQMMAHWGFDRGFESWREFEVDWPDSDCEHITGAALDWLKAAAVRNRAAPFFLFLHYYDVHDPYDAPEEYRRRFGVTLGGLEARDLASRHRYPSEPIADPKELASLIAAYDAQLPWVDHELGRLLASVPRDTLVVIFADHGEAFKEHGWTLHGATLYEEEVHVPLLIRLPQSSSTQSRLTQSRSKQAAVNESVMLLDVAPTILAACGIRPPVQFQGMDLRPLWEGQVTKQRLVPAESKAVLEGRYTRSLVLYPLKAVYSLFDGQFELYKLPDEHKNIAGSDSAAAQALFEPLRRWMNAEQYWMVHATGAGDFEAEITLDAGQFALFIPVGLDLQRDRFDVSPDGRTIHWQVYPGGAGKVKSLLFETESPRAQLLADFKINGTRSEKAVFAGKQLKHPDKLPVRLDAQIEPVSPVVEKPFAADRDGFYVFRHASGDAQRKPSKVEPLDEQTIKKLKSLGYLQ